MRAPPTAPRARTRTRALGNASPVSRWIDRGAEAGEVRGRVHEGLLSDAAFIARLLLTTREAGYAHRSLWLARRP